MTKTKQLITQWVRNIFDIASRDVINSMIDEVRTDVLAMQYLSPLNVNFVPWTKPAMRPGAIASILNDIIINRRNSIVECGSGISTIYIARLLKQLRWGHLYSIEHDEKWIETLMDLLATEKEFVTFIHAPIVSLDTIQVGVWYDPDPIKNTLNQKRIDMLIVDGPPSRKSGDLIRYPAVPILKDFFSDNYAVVLDDVNRRGEKEILELWKKDLDLDFHLISHAAIGLSSVVYKSYI